MSGDEICRRLSDEGVLTRVMMLTASGTVEDKVAGLALGADDYLAKPFAFAELVARVRALGRRTTPAAPPVLTAGDIELDSARRTVTRGRRADRADPQGVRGPRDAAHRAGRRRQQRGAARPGVGRERRPVHDDRPGHDDDAAAQARRTSRSSTRWLGSGYRIDPARAVGRDRRGGRIGSSEVLPPDAAHPHGVAVRRIGPARRRVAAAVHLDLLLDRCSPQSRRSSQRPGTVTITVDSASVVYSGPTHGLVAQARHRRA